MFTPIFPSITVRTLAAAFTAFIMCLILGPQIIAKLKERLIGQHVREEGPESHYYKKGIPTMGGMMIILAVFITSLFWTRWNQQIIISMVSIMGFGFIGFMDDYSKICKKQSEGFTPKQKLRAQVIVSLIIGFLVLYSGSLKVYTFDYDATTGRGIRNEIPAPQKVEIASTFTNFPLLGIVDLGYLYIPFIILVLVGSSNAVNLTDGLDGMASGILASVAFAYSVIAYIVSNIFYSHHLKLLYTPGCEELTVFLAAVVGACIGFLWFNAHPAEIFMGDTGSLALGGVIATVAVLCRNEIMMVIVGGVFVMEALSVIIQVFSYKTRKKRVFRMAPIHHHFELMGWHENKVVVRFYIISIIFVIISLAILGAGKGLS